jgi:hypothetical protein
MHCISSKYLVCEHSTGGETDLTSVRKGSYQLFCFVKNIYSAKIISYREIKQMFFVKPFPKCLLSNKQDHHLSGYCGVPSWAIATQHFSSVGFAGRLLSREK